MTVALGWAVIDKEGRPLLPTVGPTRRSALVNWLVTSVGTGIWSNDSDAYIEQLWEHHAPLHGATVASVSVRPA